MFKDFAKLKASASRRTDEMFPKAKKAKLEMVELGAQIMARKNEVQRG